MISHILLEQNEILAQHYAKYNTAITSLLNINDKKDESRIKYIDKANDIDKKIV